MLGSAVFVIYSSLILFDLLLTLFVLAFFLALLSFANGRGLRYAVLAGIFVGFGVLTKGPVMLIHIACPILLYPLWRNPFSSLAPRQFFSGMALMLLTAVVPVLAWLGPALYQTGSDFAYSLIWRQAAGRVSGDLESAHARPVYFYLLLAPIGLLPWVLSPYFWRSEALLRVRKGGDADPQEMRILRLLTIWCLAEFVVFSMISGKQPHYLMPLLPLVILIFGYFMAKVRLSLIKITAVVMLALFGVGEAIASMTVFPRYDLAQLAAFVAENPTADWAFSGKYHGELTFLARMEKPFAIISKSTSDEWLRTHPDGYVVTDAGRHPELVQRVVFRQPATSRYLVLHGDAPQAIDGQ
jgi:4-amino-4-deoxy-L-arabinose transferase-like glycosyltransferase